MPYFMWTGIDIQGVLCHGTRFARSVEVLEARLLEQETALLTARVTQFQRIKTIPKKRMAEIAEHLGHMLDMGIRLAQALEIVSKTTDHALARAVVADCAQAVYEGIALSQALSYHVPMMEASIVPLVAAGEESGSLAAVFTSLAAHYKHQEDLAKKMRSALIMPAITSISFIIITVLLAVFVLPRFEALFVMLNKPIPPVTYALFGAGAFVRSILSWQVLGACCCLFVALTSLWRRVTVEWKDALCLKIPGIGYLIRIYSLTLFLQTTAVLLEGGVQAAKAVALAAQVIDNRMLRQEYITMQKDIESGISCSQAFAKIRYSKEAPELVSLLTIGETAGTLALVLKKASDLYHKKTYALLERITVLIPPFLLVMIGLIVGLLVFALYTPLLSLSKLVG